MTNTNMTEYGDGDGLNEGGGEYEGEDYEDDDDDEVESETDPEAEEEALRDYYTKDWDYRVDEDYTALKITGFAFNLR